MEMVKDMTLEQAGRISSPAIRGLVTENILLGQRMEGGESLTIRVGYDKFTHSKSSCQCVCVVGGMG
ncbi:MAG: hypothetical protein LBL86_04035 [Coriobacteriales bacterium]|jgi:hypothetical protein|nr:hypothetical protein [Coriobacteriales bacterium]